MIIRTDVNRFNPKPEIEALGDTQTEMRTYEMGSGLAVGRQLHQEIILLSLSCCTQSKPERPQELKSSDQLSFSPQQHLQALQQLTDKRYLIPFIFSTYPKVNF